VKITDKTADRYLWVIGISSYGRPGPGIFGELGVWLWDLYHASRKQTIDFKNSRAIAAAPRFRRPMPWCRTLTDFLLSNSVTAIRRAGCCWAGTRGDGVPHFFRQGARPALPHFFGLKFVQKLVHCCNWLLTETQCKIISVRTAELISICYRHSNTSRCITGQDQRSAVIIFLTCTSVRVCRPKLF